MKLYNTLSRKVEDFAPADDVVKMYVCGITPYSQAHVGHALRSVVFDVMRRYLEYTGHAVRHVENFTDIDDKMINGAKEEGISTAELAERNIDNYFQVMDGLNVLRAHAYPRATEEIPRICEIIETLREKECAYAVAGDVYFSVRSDPDYGKLSRRSLEEMRAGARVEVDEKKTDEMDFALWKAQKPGEPAWDSPWGPGRPGWHIECSAMSAAHLGKTLDIHGGGQDLIFPHHENELAQSESYTDGVQLARFWLHNGMLRVDDNKMGKSLGNTISVEEALDAFSPDALRLFFLSSHYRSPLMYSAEGVEAQERAAERLRNAAEPTEEPDANGSLDPSPFVDRFTESMDDDMNTPRAMAALFDLVREINRASENGAGTARARESLGELAGVLGLTLERTDGDGEAAPLVDLLVQTRAELRAAKMYAQADGIRDRLEELGYVLEDGPGGTIWKRSAQSK
jgi:cysteinyl-tRNA synthetase